MAAERRGTILIVEDDEELRTAVEETLVERGYTIESAVCGGEALLALDELGDSVRLILLDIMLPRMNGLEFLKVFWRSRFATIPVVVMSAVGHLYSPESLHASALIQKPFDIRTLMETVEAACL